VAIAVGVESGLCASGGRYDGVLMLMWLSNATTETQRKGLADYFRPTIAISRLSVDDDGMFGGHSSFTDPTLANSCTGLSKEQPVEPDASISVQNEAGAKSTNLSEIEMLNMPDTSLLGKSGESIVFKNALKHITTGSQKKAYY
jgi:chemotaxis protein MotB